MIYAGDDGTHAEGYAGSGGEVVAVAPGAHAEGYATGTDVTIASGLGAHAEGGGCQAVADFSHAGGHYSQATLLTQTAHASGMFQQPGDAQATNVQMFTATTNATPTELSINGDPPTFANRYRIASGNSYAVTLTVHARDSQAQAHAMFKRMFIIQESNGAVALIGTPQVIGADINPQALGLTINADNTNKSLQILVTGLTGRNIRWLADIELVVATLVVIAQIFVVAELGFVTQLALLVVVQLFAIELVEAIDVIGNFIKSFVIVVGIPRAWRHILA